MPWKIVKPGKPLWPGKPDLIIVGATAAMALAAIIYLLLKS